MNCIKMMLFFIHQFIEKVAKILTNNLKNKQARLSEMFFIIYFIKFKIDN